MEGNLRKNRGKGQKFDFSKLKKERYTTEEDDADAFWCLLRVCFLIGQEVGTLCSMFRMLYVSR